MKRRLFVICTFLAFVGLMSSCGDSKKYQINNTQDWVDFVSSASGAKEIDKCFMSMSPRQIINIYEEMVPAIVHITTQEFDAKSKCRAFMWLYCGIIAHSDRFTPEQYNQIENRDSNEEMAWRICFTCIGSEADEISKERVWRLSPREIVENSFSVQKGAAVYSVAPLFVFYALF